MMKQLHKLELINFKAFRGYTFEFFETDPKAPNQPIPRRHALIFGSNGSGKSSLFWALYTLLQSSGKSSGEVAKYFEPYDHQLTNTHQSLRNVYAPTTENTTVGLAWIDEVTGQETWRRIGLRQHETLPQPNGPDNTTFRALRRSDFLHYRSLQNFFNQPHSEPTRLWPVFEHEILPFARPNVHFQSDQTLGTYWDQILKGPPKGKTKQRISAIGSPAQLEYVQLLDNFNEEIRNLLLRLNTATDTFLQKHFFGGWDKLRVEMKLVRGLDFELARRADWGALDIQLVVYVPEDADGPPVKPIVRPHTFLNEAQLTRVAFGIRLAALQDRKAKSGINSNDLSILCLDDVLISLDMSNRQHLLDWLFDETEAIGNDYQILFLTHERELFKMVREYITRKEAKNDWQIFELVLDEDDAPADRKPFVLPESADYYEQAWASFKKHDLAACAHYLRKDAEAILKAFVPMDRYWTPPKANGDTQPVLLGTLIPRFNEILKAHNQFKPPLDGLDWAKKSALNPLSHDHYSTTAYQNEIKHLLKVVFPALHKLKRRDFIALSDTGHYTIALTDVDASGKVHQLEAEVYDPIWCYDFADDTSDLSHAPFELKGIKIADTNGNLVPGTLNDSIKKCSTFLSLHQHLHKYFKKIGQAVTNRPTLESVVHKL